MISAFNLFSVVIGPSSSHTVGPMRPARRFAVEACDLGTALAHGSRALTGKGHGTAPAMIAGLHGDAPETVDAKALVQLAERTGHDRRIRLLGRRPVGFDPAVDIRYARGRTRHGHANALRLTALDLNDTHQQSALTGEPCNAPPPAGSHDSSWNSPRWS
jgi:L-serine dehydratase